MRRSRKEVFEAREGRKGITRRRCDIDAHYAAIASTENKRLIHVVRIYGSRSDRVGTYGHVVVNGS